MLILLDRDGVLNQNRDDYVKSPGELVMLPGAAEAVAQLNRAGHRVAVCTNQSAVGRGVISAEMLERIHQALRENLARAGARIDALFACTDPPWAASDRRKPGPGMLLEAMRQFRVSPYDCVMIGDDLVDLQAAARANVRRILVRTGKGRRTQAAGIPPEVLPVAVHEDLPAAVAALLGS
jgi:D-glycero-D-manno-heptose 1,7-bisphosphate phosphatase